MKICVTMCLWEPWTQIRLVQLTASHLTELLRGIDNTVWLGNGNFVQHRKESVKRMTELEKERVGEKEASERGGQLHCITPF